MEIRWALLAAMTLGVAGCDDVSDADDVVRSYDTLVEAQDALYEASEDLDLTDPSTLPTTGSATYDGVMSLGSERDGLVPDMAGELSLDVSFADASLTGEADNFVTGDGERMTGSINIENGEIDADADTSVDFTYSGDVDGQLEDEDGGTYDFAGTMDGDFLGEDHDYAQGFFDGVVVTPDGNDNFEGEFIAER